MIKFKKILSLAVTAALLQAQFSSVFAASNIENIVYKTSGSNVTASVEVTADGQKRILVLSAYKDGCLKKITGDSKIVNGTETLTTSIDKSGTDEIIATVIDSFTGKPLTKKAVYGTNSTALEYIKVDGKAIAYDDATDEYWVQCATSNVSIDFSVMDATTKAKLSDYEVPGNAEISVVSSSGKKRNIVLHLYKSEGQLSKLVGMKYKIADDVYEVPDFNPSTNKYTVEVADNVQGVTLIPNAMGDVTCTIVNDIVSEINGVSLGNMYNTGAAAFKYEHSARYNYIPIKSEKTTAYVTVQSGDSKTQYQFDFIAKQPRLTSFEYVGAADDSYKPIFVSGSAVNNDGGTIFSMDRRWTLGNISKALLGGSCFMFPASNKDSQWWNSNTSGEYFNFTADTSGKVYVLSANSIENSEYEGWTKGTNSANPPDGKTWPSAAKDWNDYEAEYFGCLIENQDDFARAIDPGIAENDGNDTMLYPVGLSNYAFKTFAAGEKVSIYHTGKTGQNGAKSIAIVVWDGVIGAPEEPKKEQEEEEIPQVIEDENKLMSLYFDSFTDTTKSVWEDTSGYKNHITFTADDNNKWTTDGLLVTAASEKAIELPIGINTAINSNVFTIQFEIAELNSVEGKKCGILSSKDGEFDIYKSNSGDTVYFKWADNTTSVSMAKITAEQLVGHVNTIVVDKTEETEAQRIRWYVDGELISNKKMKTTNKTVEKMFLSSTNNTYAGSVVFKSLTIYKKALTLQEITGGSGK